MLGDKSAFVRQPRSACRRERLLKIRKGYAALEIVISGHAENRRIDLLDKGERFRSEMRLLDEITGKADEVRRKLVDCANDLGGILDVTLVMEISEMNQAAAARPALRFVTRNLVVSKAPWRRARAPAAPGRSDQETFAV